MVSVSPSATMIRSGLPRWPMVPPQFIIQSTEKFPKASKTFIRDPSSTYTCRRGLLPGAKAYQEHPAGIESAEGFLDRRRPLDLEDALIVPVDDIEFSLPG